MTVEKKLYRDGPYADLFCQGIQVGNSCISLVGGRLTKAPPNDIVEQDRRMTTFKKY